MHGTITIREMPILYRNVYMHQGNIHIPKWGKTFFRFWRVDFRQKKKYYFSFHLYWVFNDISEDISKKKTNVHRLMYVNVCRTRCWLGFYFSTWKCESLLGYIGRNEHISFWIPFYVRIELSMFLSFFFIISFSYYLYRNLLPNSRFTIIYREK